MVNSSWARAAAASWQSQPRSAGRRRGESARRISTPCGAVAAPRSGGGRMLKILDAQGAYEQQPGFPRPSRLRLSRGPTAPAVAVVTAEPFTTWLVRLGPEVAPALSARYGLDPCALFWIAETP